MTVSKCKYCITTKRDVPTIGDDDVFLIEHDCALKRKSPIDQARIYGDLQQKNLEGSIISDICPVAETEQWSKCPHYKK